jgi:hypothetical protein
MNNLKPVLLGFVIFILLLVPVSPSFLYAETKYPKTLSVDNAIQYFATHPKFEMRKPHPAFEFIIKGNDIERYCFHCNTPTGYGNVRYDKARNEICFDWDYVSFPASGCFTFVQTGPGTFELQNKRRETVYAWGTGENIEIKPGDITYKEEFERAILIDLEEMNPPQEKIHLALVQAMKNKGWRIEKNTPELIIANLERHGSSYRVMAKIRGPWVGVGFLRGFAPRSDGWLYNIKQQLLIQLGR